MERRTGALEVGREMDNPAWYGTTTPDGLSIGSTTVEVGSGVKRDSSTILLSGNAFDWYEFMSFKKDR